MDTTINANIPSYSYASRKKEDSSGVEKLTEQEKRQVLKLQARDAEVKAHEAAHQGAAGGAATYSYQQGPDGKMYAIGGEVSITIRSGSTPEETIANAQQVIAAALAPADPSPQDMAVASSARSLMIKAQQEKAKELLEQTQAHLKYKEEEKSFEINSSENESKPIKGLDISA